ncbi:MAG: serine hydrolase domain-containing protein [Thermomicrobiales bacterium]
MTATTNDIANHPDVASNIALLEVWLQAKMAYGDLPGTAVGIVHDQELIYACGFGHADVESGTALTKDSIFRIASHSKLFTAISIMQLRDAGKLQLDDPIAEHLPWFNIQNRHPDARPITIRHLLTHTSGLPREAGSAYWLNFDFPTLEQVRERLSGQETIFPTETRWKYSNLALTLAGEIVAAASGKSFADYVQESILGPLGMSSTSVVFPDDQRDRLVTPYSRRLPEQQREPLPFVDAVGMAAATGLSSSVSDMARFISWQFRLLDGKETEIISAHTLKEMQRPHWVQPDWKSGWGIGFGIEHRDDRDLIGHGGGYPGNLTSTRISPEERVGVIVFTNSADGSPQEISDRIFEWVAPAIARAAEGDEGTAPDPSWEGYTGTYRNLWGESHVLPLDGKLMMISPVLPNPKPDALTLEPAGERSFTMEGKGSGPLGELVVFDPGDDGKAQRVKVGEGWSERVTYPVPLHRSNS